MPTAKIYGLRSVMDPVKRAMSDAIHSCVAEALDFPAEKRLQRFFPLADGDFFYGEGRSEKYTVIEIALFEGRSKDTLRKLLHLLYERVPAATGIPRTEIDIMIFEVPRHAWGLQGKPGDEQDLGYKVAI